MSVVLVVCALMTLPASTASAVPAPKLQQGPIHAVFRWCEEKGCDAAKHAERQLDIQLDAPRDGSRAEHVTRTDITSDVSAVSNSVISESDAKKLTNKPSKQGAPPEQALGGKKIRLADAYGPDCCSDYGGGVLDVTNTQCDYTHTMCFDFHTQVWWNWGDGRVWNQRPGLDYWAEPDTYQWLDYNSCCYQDGGVVWGLPEGYYDYQGRGYGSGFLSHKAQVVHNCLGGSWACSGDYQPWTDMYVHNDGSWYANWGV